jgi:hypothetical protein
LEVGGHHAKIAPLSVYQVNAIGTGGNAAFSDAQARAGSGFYDRLSTVTKNLVDGLNRLRGIESAFLAQSVGGMLASFAARPPHLQR